MAIILGAQASLRDRKSNANELIKTRNVNLVHRILGQLSAIASIIVLLEIVALLTSFILIWVIQKTPLNIGAVFSLLGYGAVSAILMIALAAIGFNGLGVPYILAVGMWLLALLGTYTVLQRMLIVKRAR